MLRAWVAGLLLGLLAWCGSAEALVTASGQRVALVIGNAAYASAPLRNPANDARDVAAKLGELDFDVVRLLDAGQREMEGAIRDFTRKLSGEGAVGLFYFAGHGIELDGQNYLVPVDADIQSAADVKYKTVNAGYVLEGMNRAGNGLNLMVLDACRNNPYTRSFRSGGMGLADMNPPRGTLVLYATEPGEVARDGEGKNGIFTGQLLEQLSVPGLTPDEVFNNTAMAVHESTGGAQTPWKEGVILGRFFFRSPAPKTLVADAPGMGAESFPPVPPAVALGHLQVSVSGASGSVTVDGRDAGSVAPGSPLNLTFLRTGDTSVSVRAAGHPVESRVVRIRPGEWAQEMFAFPAATASDARSGSGRVGSSPTEKGEGTGISGDLGIDAETGWMRLADMGSPGSLTGVGARGEKEPLTMIFVPGGCFSMGSADGEVERDVDETLHRVCLEGFHLGATEVTVGEFRQFVDATGYRTMAETETGEEVGCWAYQGDSDPRWDWRPWASWRIANRYQANVDDHPVTCVAYRDVEAYLDWLSRASRWTYRLPTEAEWEYAARAGTTSARFWGEDSERACSYANVADLTPIPPSGEDWADRHACRDGYPFVAPVRHFNPNPLGLYDMLGNVSEWTCSPYDSSYSGQETLCPGRGDASPRAVRGGSWLNGPRWIRAAARNWGPATTRGSALGFRVAR